MSKLETAWWALGQEPGRGEGSGRPGGAGTPEESHRQCTGRGGGGGKGKHSAGLQGREPRKMERSQACKSARPPQGGGRRLGWGGRDPAHETRAYCVSAPHPSTVSTLTPQLPKWKAELGCLAETVEQKGIWGSSSSPSWYIPVGGQH